MQSFTYARAATLDDAVMAAADGDTALIAGGTELVNWMKEAIVTPRRLVDINGIAALASIVAGPRGLQIGALARMSDVAEHPIVREQYPLLTQALLASASEQIRNAASIGGNLMQRTRCPYFRAERELPCNKRRAGSGCSALEGDNRFAAIFGWTEHCVATHPSDAAVALVALGAAVDVKGPQGTRTIALEDLHRLPDDAPTHETTLQRGEVITAIVLPARAIRSCYFKVRERASYEFALVSAAAIVEVNAGLIQQARLALGGVAAKPWRLPSVERALIGVSTKDYAALQRAIAMGFTGAQGLRHNEFKIELAQRTALRALQTAAGAR